MGPLSTPCFKKFIFILLFIFNVGAAYAVNAESMLKTIWGTPIKEPRLTLGMWSLHASEAKRNGRNNMLGITYKSYFLGTFVNSFYLRAYAAGIQRNWVDLPLTHDIHYQLGYRLGLVTGYQGHNLIGIESLKNSPAIPFAQLVFSLHWKHLGWELSAPNTHVISTSFFIRFY